MEPDQRNDRRNSEQTWKIREIGYQKHSISLYLAHRANLEDENGEQLQDLTKENNNTKRKF